MQIPVAEHVTTVKACFRLSVLAAALAIAGCYTYVAENRYPTLADAKADRLFERGWLPDLLPPSSFDIHTINNLDASTSTGSFRFSPTDGPLLFGKLTTGASAEAPFSDWPATLMDYKRRGFIAWRHRKGYERWVFFCIAREGRCEYVMWSTRWSTSASGR